MHQLEVAGINTAIETLNFIEDPQERAIFAKIVAESLLGSTDYIFQKYAEYLSGRHPIPMTMLATEQGIAHTPETLTRKVFEDLGEAARLSAELADTRRNRLPLRNLPAQTARAHGRAALTLSVWPMPRISENARPQDVQDMVFETAVDLRSGARIRSKSIGTQTSVAQLADKVSPLGVHILTAAPDTVSGAFERAA